jgi:hypothetical protein
MELYDEIAPPLNNFYTKICSLGEGEAEDQVNNTV